MLTNEIALRTHTKSEKQQNKSNSMQFVKGF